MDDLKGCDNQKGRDTLKAFPADKQWYDLPLDVPCEGFGCRVYRIYASCCEQDTRLCQLTYATAIWMNRREQRIESSRKHWWGWTGGICFRWLEKEGKPCLQIRSKKPIPSEEIHCKIVELYKR